MLDFDANRLNTVFVNISTVLITGAGGFVGTLLVEKLIAAGFKVKALDTFWFGNHLRPAKNLEILRFDLRDRLPIDLLTDVDAVIHLACISNDPSYEINVDFSNSINIEASKKLIDFCRQSDIKRFIFASSSSVYGVKSELSVTEDLDLMPLTPYSSGKVEVEKYLSRFTDNFDIVILRPATLYGYSPRLRLDLVSNIFAAQAFFEKKITIFGGLQQRPQLHIQKMLAVYLNCLKEEKHFVGEIFNIGEGNFSVTEIADSVKSLFSENIEVSALPSSDNRSYRIGSEKYEIYFNTKLTSNLIGGLGDLVSEFKKSPEINWQSPQFHNVKTLKQFLSVPGTELGLK